MPAVANGQLMLQNTPFVVHAIQAALYAGDYRRTACFLAALARNEMMNGVLHSAMKAVTLAIEFTLRAAQTPKPVPAGEKPFHTALAELIELRNTIQNAQEQTPF